MPRVPSPGKPGPGASVAPGIDIDDFLRSADHKSLLRFITCGSVDDGKSTLIGRLLFDSQKLHSDQLAVLSAEALRRGDKGHAIDLAQIVDGLAAEREQGITIDVAYRFFATDVRKFIVADTPGHEQYTRNMVTGASTADLAVVLVDARAGIVSQTRRHAYLAHLMGIGSLVLAVTKMDLVEYAQARFAEIADEFGRFIDSLGMSPAVAIPVSGLGGDNVVAKSERMPWYDGPPLLAHLETVEIANARMIERPFRMAVQYVNRPNQEFRGICGLIGSGEVRPGDAVRIQPGSAMTTIKSIVTHDGDLHAAVAGQSVTLTFNDDVDCSRGDLVAASSAPCEIADSFDAMMVWMDTDELLPGRSYLMKIGTRTVVCSVANINHEVAIDTLEHTATRTLGLNAIGSVNIVIDRAIPFEAYCDNPDLGAFILIDRMTNRTVAAGMLRSGLHRSHLVQRQVVDTAREAHAALKGQTPCVVWFTGYSGAGKSTIANLVEARLHALGRHTFLLDGDNIRHGLNRDLGFDDADRVENIRRIGEVARLMADAGLIVLTAFISPFRSERRMARDLLPPGEFIEVFIDTPLAVAETRDVKGLYKKARAGQLKKFTGIDSPYEPPESPEIRVDTLTMTAQDAADLIVDHIIRRRA